MFNSHTKYYTSNLTIANTSRVSCAHNTYYVQGIYSNSVTLKCSLGVTQVIGNGIIRQIAYDFLLAFYRNYCVILYRLQDTESYWPKIANFFAQPVFSSPQGVTPSEFRDGV